MDFMQLLLDPVCVVAIALALLSILYVLKGTGNIPHMRGGGAIYEVATNLRQQYGDVVRLKLGPINNVILIMGKDKIHKAAVTMNDKFKYRPTNFFATNYISKQKGITFSNGDVHAAIRKFTLGTMRDFGVGKKSLEGRMQEEAGM
ncbi:cytochrome P450 2B1-like [Mercenaria mercenaria]|uniref:cytochrome P450 2B1-like n=1 Tax=Mercenaria mercenaria TaxID=6596 RepID=UPI00234F7BE7|nr:cytochrome P450 2B1-like [Mercenaria mercenaria]